MTPPIFVDLDGVLVDFDAGVQRLTGKTPAQFQKQHGLASFWSLLARTPDFYAKLPAHPDGPRIWRAVREYNPTILSGVPHGDWAAPQKRAWVKKYLGETVPVITCLSRDKHTYASPGAILIDDSAKLGPAWEAAGGLFIHHIDIERTLFEIEVAILDAQSRSRSG